ncbi:kinase-like protein [Panus rudis PR-1116 ss-1]|nr:kinase-like protein [Panus rudis PR-1116 ss-1]
MSVTWQDGELCSSLSSHLLVQDISDIMEEPMAFGGYADIYRARYRGEPVVLKRLRIFEGSDKSRELKRFIAEAQIWQTLDHGNILPLIGIYCKTPTSFPLMVSPLMSRGDIHKAMRDLNEMREYIPYDRWIQEIAHGIRYLHSEAVIHGDLRGANILIDEDLHVRLADFGLACYVGVSTASLGSRSSGAARWAAPELMCSESDIVKPTFACDIYSFGSVCVEIYTHRVPYAECPREPQVIARIQKGIKPLRPDGVTGKRMSDGLWDIIQRCWRSEPNHRPAAEELVSALEYL